MIKKREFKIDEVAFQMQLGKPLKAYDTNPQHVKAGRMLEEMGYEIDQGDIDDTVYDQEEIQEQQGPLVLIIEDNADVRAYIREELIPDYRIIEAPDGEDGIARAIEEVPDLVISDVMMPKKDGYQVCQALKSWRSRTLRPYFFGRPLFFSLGFGGVWKATAFLRTRETS